MVFYRHKNLIFPHHAKAGVHIIPKIADFLDPKIIFCPNFKTKCPQLKKHFQIPLTHLLPFAPNYKKMPPIKITFSNSTNTFAPICPQLPLIGEKMPPIKNTFSNSTNTFAPQLPPIIKKMPPIKKNAPN